MGGGGGGGGGVRMVAVGEWEFGCHRRGDGGRYQACNLTARDPSVGRGRSGPFISPHYS